VIPGLVSRLSERVVSLTNIVQVDSDILRVNSTTTTTVLTTLLSRVVTGKAGTIVFVVNGSGNNITTNTTGNIAVAATIANGNMAVLVYSPSSGKWHRSLSS